MMFWDCKKDIAVYNSINSVARSESTNYTIINNE